MASVSEKIDERILRLLGLEDVFDLDYDTYLTLLKEAIVTGAKKLPQEELALLANERKRVRGKKGRFEPKKDKITADKVSITKFLKPAKKTLALPPSPTTSSEEGGGFVGIKKTLDSILSTLGSKFKFDQKQADEDRKEKETEKRGKREASLEGFKKGVAGIVATTKKMLDPFQAIIERIKRFIFFTLLGRAFTKFMEWMSDKGNQEKFNSFIEFLTDHWPALAGIYVLFGTSFGKLVRGLLKGVTRMTVALLTNIPRIASFIKRKPRIAGLLFSTAALTSGYISREVKDIFSDKKESPEAGLIPTKNPDLDQAKQDTNKAANTKVPTLNFGGMVPKFNVGGMLPSFAMGGMDFSGGVPITGAGQDDTLIAAKTGEAILTEKDQQDIGQRYVDRNTGQPLNIPQYLAGRKPGSVAMSNLRFPGFGGGFFNGGVVSKFKDGGVIGMQGGGSTKVRAENPRITPGDPDMGRGSTTYKPKLTLADSIALAKSKLLERQALRNTNIRNNYRPWWQRLNPFADKRPFNLRIPHPPIENYRMPGFDSKGWRILDEFRETPQEEYNKPNPKSPKLRYAPGMNHLRPGIDKPLALQGGGLIGGLDSFGRSVFENVGGSVGKTKGRETGLPGGGWFGEKLGERKGRDMYEKLTNPLRRQGGGLVNGNNVTDLEARVDRMINQGLPQTLSDYNQQIEQGQSQPINPQTFRQELEKQRHNLKMRMMRNHMLHQQSIPKKIGGGWFGEKLGERKGRDMYEKLTNPLRRQGGGLIETSPKILGLPNELGGGGGGTDALTEQAKVKTFGSAIKGFLFGESKDTHDPQRYKGGGLYVKENTGMNVKGATADRQRVDLQPGEYVLPVDTVNRLGTSLIDKLVAMTDSNSNPYLGRGTVRRPQITPYNSFGSNRGGMMTLPPITQSVGGSRARSAGLGGGSEVPEFSATAPGNERAMNASIYGLVG